MFCLQKDVQGRSTLLLPHAEEKLRLSRTWNKEIKKYFILELVREESWVLVHATGSLFYFIHPLFVDKIAKQL